MERATSPIKASGKREGVMGYKISFDPGINATGYCVWWNGKVKDVGTIRTQGQEDVDKLSFLGSCLVDLFERLFPIDAVAVEKFQGGFHPKKKSDGSNDENYGVYRALDVMKKCAAAQGVIIGVARTRTQDVRMTSKRTIKKTDTALLIKAYGITQRTSKDARDAFQIGICAGFDRG